MRFRKRLSAVLLAAAMLLTSAQLPGGVSYAAQLSDGAEMAGGGQNQPDSSTVTDGAGQKEAEDAVAGDDSQMGEESQPGGDDQTGDDSQSVGDDQPGDDGRPGEDDFAGDGNQAEDGSQPGDNDQTEDGGQPGDDNQTGDDTPGDDTPTDGDNQMDDDSQAGEDKQTDTENDLGKEEDTAHLSGYELEPSERIVDAEIEGAFQFGDIPELATNSGISLYSAADSPFDYGTDVKDFLYRQMVKRTEYIDLYEAEYFDITQDAVSTLIGSVVNMHPDLCFVNKDYQCVLDDTDHVIVLMMSYNTCGDDHTFKENVNAALTCVTDGMTDVEKAVVLHDWLVTNTEYGFTGEQWPHYSIVPDLSYTIYGPLGMGMSVCNGYALAYKYLLDHVGVDSVVVASSEMGDGKGHAWNLVKLNGEWYHADTTWDDPGDRIGGAMHTYLFSDASHVSQYYGGGIAMDGNGNIIEVTDTTTYASAFWRQSRAPLVFRGSDCYYIDGKGILKKADFSNITDVGKEIVNIGNLQSGLCMINDRLFYNDATSIYSIKTDGTEQRTEFTADTIVGSLVYRKGVIYYETADGELVSVDIEKDGEFKAQYRLEYRLDGGINDSGNPESYHSGMETIVLKAPTKEGYRFVGWYTDESFTRRVTEIPQGSRGDIRLYARWRPVTENPMCTFMTLDDKEVSSRADGRPKVLVFFDTDAAESQKTIADLSEHIKAFDGVDIYAIESFGKKTKAEVIAYKEQYGGDGITYCYDKDGSNGTYAGEYAGGKSGNPVVAIIDAENRVQRVTVGRRGGNAVLRDLQEYCGYDDAWWYITYMLNGGENNSENPNMYQRHAGDITLQDPSKAGYNFAGWYKDAAFTEQVTEISGESMENIRCYAKWVERDGLYLSNYDDYMFTALDNTKFSVRAEGRRKLLVFYDVVGSDSAATIKEITGIIDKLDGVDICAVNVNDKPNGRPMNTSILDKNLVSQFRDNYGCDEITFAYMSDLEEWQSYPSSMKQYLKHAGIETSSVTPPVICYIDEGNNLQWVSHGNATAADILEKLVKSCGYSLHDGRIYRIVYELDGGTNDRRNPTAYMSDMNTFVLRDASKTGYTFEGWYKDAAFQEQVTQIEKGSAGDITLYAKWREVSEEPGTYRITYELNGGTNNSENPETYTEETETIVLKDAVREGFVFDGWYRDAQFTQKVEQIVKGSTGDITLYAKWTPQGSNEAEIEITFAEKSFVYNGEAQEPEVVVTTKDADGKDITLEKGTDYTLSYQNNKDAGTATVTVKGIGEYTGEVSENFIIEPAPLVIRAMDLVILLGDSIPEQYKYEMDGLCGTDELIKEPVLSCKITGTETEGEYAVIPSGADAGSNYTITYENGVLRVVSERNTCKVTFDVQGHGRAPVAYTGISCGNTIDSPEEPTAEGYRFDGWYKDTACTKPWNFETDTVQSDLTLYAKWLVVDNDGEFAVQEIADLYYNGKAQKPAVSVYDGDKLLKAGKDYTIKYCNNTNANAGSVRKSETFNQNLPYVEITGKGNYKETVKINFNILPASIGEGYTPAAGVTLKVNDHLVKAAKALKPFGSIKLGRSMKAGTDYELNLEAMIARDASGSVVFGSFENAQVPAGYTGEFVLTVTGKGNYTGSISRNVYVADKDHLMKNVKITLGKDVKNIAYTGSKIELKAAEKQKPANDEFVVTYGRTVLKPETDYYVTYSSNTGVGRAELIVIGKGEYVGKKTVNFNITGKKFSNGTVTVTGLEDRAYTGGAVVQNQNAVLTWKADGRKLEYGTDYSVSYSKNINKGTATITFTGKAEAGYSGKVSKKFKIGTVDIADTDKVARAESMRTIILPYSKAGVKPVEEIILTNGEGTRLRYGKDYTLTYKNNKAVANANAEKAPTVTVKGKGNYSGSFDVKFTIVQADLRGESITVECAQVAYNSKKPDTYIYKPAVKVKDGKIALKAGKDYEINYEKNTQADCNSYIQNLVDNQLNVPPTEGRAMAVITGKEGSAYSLQEPIRVPLEIYMTKLTKNSLSVEIDEDGAVYTGEQIRPKVTVTYTGEGGGFPLTEGVDYTLVYGANIASGKNKGSVTVKGLAPDYGGSVTYKFEISRKDLKYRSWPATGDKK